MLETRSSQLVEADLNDSWKTSKEGHVSVSS